MSEYIKVKLGDLIEERNERCSDPQESGYERFVGLEHMDTGRLEVKRYGSTDDVTTSCKLCHKGDMLFGRRNPYLRRAGVINFDSTCSGDIIVFRPSSDRIVPEYIPIVLATKQFWTAAMTDQGGTMSKRVHFEDFAQYEFDLPDLDTQRKLSELIWSYEKLICDCEEQLQNLDLLVKSRFIEMIKSKGYPLKTIGDSCVKTRVGPFGSALHKTEIVSEGPVFVLGTDNAVDNEFKVYERRYISSEKYSELERYTVVPGDIIITMMGTIGRSAVIPENFKTAIISSHLSCLTVNTNVVLPKYLQKCMVLDHDVSKHLDSNKKGSIMSGLNLKIIKAIPFSCPPLNVQKEFMKFVEQVDKSKFKLQQYLDYLKAMQISVINGPKVNP